jgi:hypothetical protein
MQTWIAKEMLEKVFQRWIEQNLRVQLLQMEEIPFDRAREAKGRYLRAVMDSLVWVHGIERRLSSVRWSTDSNEIYTSKWFRILRLKQY